MSNIRLDKASEKATRSAMNKVIKKASVAASRKVREVYNIKASQLNKYIKIYKYNSRTGQAAFVVKGRPVRLIHFSARQNKKGVSVKVRKDRGRRLLKSHFIARSTVEHVWRRESKSRYPIKPLFTIAPSKMFEVEGAKALEDIIKSKAGEMYEHELVFYINKELRRLGPS